MGCCVRWPGRPFVVILQVCCDGLGQSELLDCVLSWVAATDWARVSFWIVRTGAATDWAGVSFWIVRTVAATDSIWAGVSFWINC